MAFRMRAATRARLGDADRQAKQQLQITRHQASQDGKGL